MRSVRVLLVAIAVAAAGLTVWALTSGGATYATTDAGPAPRPRIDGFGSEPVFGTEGGFWQLPPGPGEASLITDATHATKVEFLLTPTGTGTAGRAVTLGVDTDGHDGYTAHWGYQDQPLLAHLTVWATGPGGVTEHVVGVHHPGPAAGPERPERSNLDTRQQAERPSGAWRSPPRAAATALRPPR